MVLNFAMGTARFTTGKMGLVAKQNIAINTPTAQITIRGTDFTSTVDERKISCNITSDSQMETQVERL